MESMESHEAGFPPFPHSLEIPSGFPHSHGLDDWRYMSSRAPSNRMRCCRKGLVTDVSGPQRNACPGTLTPLRSFCVLQVYFSISEGGVHAGMGALKLAVKMQST